MNILWDTSEKRFVLCIISVLIVFFFYEDYHYKCYDVNSTTTASKKVYSDNVTNTYVNWILAHSSKISRQTATDIFNTAMSIENGLLYVAIGCMESNFDPTAESKMGALGLNQIMPGIWVEELIEQGIIKEKRDLFDYDKSLYASRYILTMYYSATGSWEKALEKYVGKKHKTYAKEVLVLYGELQLLKQE